MPEVEKSRILVLTLCGHWRQPEDPDGFEWSGKTLACLECGPDEGAPLLVLLSLDSVQCAHYLPTLWEEVWLPNDEESVKARRLAEEARLPSPGRPHRTRQRADASASEA